MNKKINFYNVFFIINFLLLILPSLFNISFLGLYDEVGSVLCLIYIIYLVTLKRKQTMNFLIFALLLLCIIGLLGNVLFNINGFNIQNIFLDMFIFLKPYLFFMAVYFYLQKHSNQGLLKCLRSISKFSLYILFIFCLVYLTGFGNLSDKFGKYVFFAGFSGNIANALVIFTVLIFLVPSKWNLIHFATALFVMYFNGSALGLLGMFIIIFFFLFTKIRFNWLYLVPFAVLAVALSYNEISGYLFNSNAPRNQMFYYSFITANKFFPLGGGFGSYGSYVAANYYSELYYQYGFNNMWGMGPVSSGVQFLFDTYYPMIIGQFGYLGLLVYLILLVNIYFKFIKKTFKLGRFYASFAMFAYILAMGLGFSIAGATGCLMYAVFALTICPSSYAVDNKL